MYVISIEGIDGAGKTSLLDALQEKIYNQKICFVSFPTEQFYRRRQQISQDDNYTEEINRLQTEDKQDAYHYWERKGMKVMICDRYDVSQKVYDGSSLKQYTVDTAIKSDFIIYLNIGVDTVMERIHNRGVEDVLGYEDADRLKQLRMRYERILKEEYKNYVIIAVENQGSVDDMASETLHILREEGYIQ